MRTAVGGVLLLFVVTPAVHTVMVGVLTAERLHTVLSEGTVTHSSRKGD